MNKFSPGKPLTAVAFVALLVLVALGTWQGRKIGPKTALIAQIEAGLAAKPQAFDAMKAYAPYSRVTLSTAVASDNPIYVFGTDLEGKPGYHHYIMVSIAKDFSPQANPVMIVNMGWVPMAYYQNGFRPVLASKGENIKLAGTLIPSAKRGMMTLENDVDDDLWYLADVNELAAGFNGRRDLNIYPQRLMADQFATNPFPKGGQVRINIPNNHLEYMFTWYGLAVSLLGVYIAFGFTRQKSL